MQNNTNVDLKTITNLSQEDIKFYIDVYQRGYRWTQDEVRNLLDDIHEFSKSDFRLAGTDKFYCLQPVIVTKLPELDAWKVIDGQQRLTTLYLIYLYLNNIAGKEDKEKMPFELHYNGKETLEKCLEEIKINEYCKVDELIQFKETYDNDIDCYYIIVAFETICEYFAILRSNVATKNDRQYMKDVFDSYMKIIWYELLNCSIDDEVSMFTKINMGKIPLTSAELIKALLLRVRDNQDSVYRDNIALKWDDMEARLSDNSFWYFITNSNEYQPRIDFIFEIVAYEINESILKQFDENNTDKEQLYVHQIYNRQYFSFHVINNYVKYLAITDPITDYIKDIWEKITEYYEMINDWYIKRNWYHMIGYLIDVSEKDYIIKLIQLSKLYREHSNNESHKTIFEEALRKLIIESIEKKEGLKSKQDLVSYIGTLSYIDTPKAVRKILLLHNICKLELLEKQTDARFPFDKMKSKTISWEIEHINAIADERPIDTYDRADNRCLVWLEAAKNIPDVEKIPTVDGKKVIDVIQNIIDNKLYLPSNDPSLKSFVDTYEAIITYYDETIEADHSIGNLTLLSADINHGYKNSVFPLKRRYILKKMSADVFVPLCTKNVFLKAFEGSRDLLKWTNIDKKAYREDIENTISKYLGLEESNNVE